jgi:hypothetical protein
MRNLTITFMVALAACGADEHTDFTIAATPAPIVIAQGGKSSVTITLTREGAQGDAWPSIAAAPTGVTGVFTPLGSDAYTLDVIAADGARMGDGTITVTVAVGDLVREIDVPITVRAAPQVAVTVLTNDRFPYPGCTVATRGQTVTTNADGVAVFPNLAAPYDLVVVCKHMDNVLRTRTLVYSGLTSHSPTILSYLSIGSVSKASISGGLFTSVAPNAVWFESPDMNVSVMNASSQFTLFPYWGTAQATVGKLHALQWGRDANGFPNAYAYAEVGLSVAPNAQINQNLTLASVPGTANLSGTLQSADPLHSFALTVRSGRQTFDVYGYTSGEGFNPAPTSLGFLVPTGLPLRYQAYGRTTFGDCRVPLEPGTPGAMTIPSGSLAIASPAPNATGVNLTTPFAWAVSPGSIYEAYINYYDGIEDQSFLYFLSGAQMTLPDLSALGATLVAGRTYSMGVVAWQQHASVDDVVTGDLLDGWSRTQCSLGSARVSFTMEAK